MKKEEIYQRLEAEYFGPNRHENSALTYLKNLLNNVDVFIDVGASLGQYTHEANQFLKGKKIIAIEADVIRFEGLKTFCRTWLKDSTNDIHPLHNAVIDTNGWIDFWVTNSNVSGALSPIYFRNHSWLPVKVPTITLTELLKEYNNQNILIKMDIEGGEYRALLGGVELLKDQMNGRSIDFFIELHWWGDAEFKKYPCHCLMMLFCLGYKVRKLYGHYYFSKAHGSRKYMLLYAFLEAMKTFILSISFFRVIKEFVFMYIRPEK